MQLALYLGGAPDSPQASGTCTVMRCRCNVQESVARTERNFVSFMRYMMYPLWSVILRECDAVSGYFLHGDILGGCGFCTVRLFYFSCIVPGGAAARWLMLLFRFLMVTSW